MARPAQDPNYPYAGGMELVNSKTYRSYKPTFALDKDIAEGLRSKTSESTYIHLYISRVSLFQHFSKSLCYIQAQVLHCTVSSINERWTLNQHRGFRYHASLKKFKSISELAVKITLLYYLYASATYLFLNIIFSSMNNFCKGRKSFP